MTHEFNEKAGISYNFKRKSPKLNDVEDVDDLLIGDFHDSFHNLTYKDSMLVNWVKHDCPSAEVGFQVKSEPNQLTFWFTLWKFTSKPRQVCFQRR